MITASGYWATDILDKPPGKWLTLEKESRNARYFESWNDRARNELDMIFGSTISSAYYNRVVVDP